MTPQSSSQHHHGGTRASSGGHKTLRTPKNRLEQYRQLKHGPEFVDKHAKVAAAGSAGASASASTSINSNINTYTNTNAYTNISTNMSYNVHNTTALSPGYTGNTEPEYNTTATDVPDNIQHALSSGVSDDMSSDYVNVDSNNVTTNYKVNNNDNNNIFFGSNNIKNDKNVSNSPYNEGGIENPQNKKHQQQQQQKQRQQQNFNVAKNDVLSTHDGQNIDVDSHNLNKESFDDHTTLTHRVIGDFLFIKKNNFLIIILIKFNKI